MFLEETMSLRGFQARPEGKGIRSLTTGFRFRFELLGVCVK